MTNDQRGMSNLIERLRALSRSDDDDVVYVAHIFAEAADHIEKAEAQLNILREGLAGLVSAVERRWPNSDFTRSIHFAEPMNVARSLLSRIEDGEHE